MQKSKAKTPQLNTHTLTTWSKLFGCSAFGILFFLTPIHIDGSWTIFLGILTSKFTDILGDGMKYFTTATFVTGAIIAAVYNLLPRKIAETLPHSSKFIASHWIWTVLALVGGIASILTFFAVGPDWVIGKETGVTAYIDVAGAIFILIGLGCLFLPFLTDFGLLEFVGTMCQRIFQKMFNLPGRATIDTLASWVGSSSIAVVMTSYQYQRGYYSARESAIIATNFSVVSIPFVYLTAQVAGITEYFLQLYVSMVFICVICALVTPKLPPLKNISDEYFGNGVKQLDEDVDTGQSRFSTAKQRALKVASTSPSPQASLKRGFVSMIDIYLMMMPAAMTIEFLTLVVYYNTSFFQIIGTPFVYILTALHVPEAELAAPGMLVGLLDQFVPTIIAGTLTEPMTKFILAGLSVTQLIFFAETALLIMRSAIPVSLIQLIAIFLIRTSISLPILVLIGHYLF